jgi:Uncharacterized conserved protein
MAEFYNYYSFQIIGFLFGLLLLVSIFIMVKKNRMQEKHSIIWIFVGVMIAVFSVNRDLLENFSALLGVSYAPSALFAILITCVYVLLLGLSASISTLKKKNKVLIQEVGLLKLKMSELEKKYEEKESEGK